MMGSQTSQSVSNARRQVPSQVPFITISVEDIHIHIHKKEKKKEYENNRNDVVREVNDK